MKPMTNDHQKPAHPAPGSEAALAPAGAASQTIPMDEALVEKVAAHMQELLPGLFPHPTIETWPAVARAAIQAVNSAQDWTVDASVLSGQILNYLGFGSDPSLEPGADRRRDKIAAMITAWREARLLWCVNVTGPDDIIAVTSYSAAIDLCDKINEFTERTRASRPHDPNWPTVRAYPLPWPWEAEHHADAVRAGCPEYGVAPLPSPPSQEG